MSWGRDHLDLELPDPDRIPTVRFLQAGARDHQPANALRDKFFQLALLSAYGGIRPAYNFLDAIDVVVMPMRQKHMRQTVPVLPKLFNDRRNIPGRVDDSGLFRHRVPDEIHIILHGTE